VEVVVRVPARAADVLRILETLRVPATLTRMAGALVDADVVVSTVPIGGQPDLLGLGWRAGQTVLDVLYAPWPTPLAERVVEAGGTVISGLEVLFWQATEQVRLMTGQPAPIAEMRLALDAALGTP
jgi:shikimate dehydrogenase